MPLRAPRAGAIERIADASAAVILAAVAIVAALTFRDYGLGWDDYTHAEYGGLLLRLFASGFTDQRALSFVNLYAYGGGFDMLAALAAKILPFDLFETRRLVGAGVGLFGLFLTWRIARRVGGPLAAVIALALLAICPLYYGHMFINAKDAPFAVAMTLLTLALVRAFAEYPAPTVATRALVGVGIGLAIGTRVMGGLAAIYALAALVLVLAVDLRRTGLRHAAGRAGAFVLSLAPALLLAYAVMALVWPWSVVAPLNPLRAVGYFSHFFEKPWKELFDGVILAVPDMPRIYVAQLFVLKAPDIFVVLGIVGAAGAFAAAARRAVAIERRAVLLFLALSATFPIALAVATRPAMYNGIRHFVFVLPAFAVLGGMAGARLIERFAAMWRPAAAFGVASLIGGLLLPVADMAKLHPYEYTHFNRIAGGVPAAADRYMLDYWGLSLKQAAQALRQKLAERGEARRPWRVAVCGPQRPVQVELGPDYVTTWEPRDADFALTLGAFYCAKVDAPLIAEVVRDSVVYARVYDIRGRAVSTLLTLPPP
jgi:4-amino-4-deoxy-L-arabinose transferase-like glycosyltransferase